MANAIDKLENFLIPKWLLVTWLSGVRVGDWVRYGKPLPPDNLVRLNVIDKLELSYSNVIRPYMQVMGFSGM